MTTFKLLGAVAVLSSLSATPVLAQAVIQEPGYCAFFYPTANCQNKGPGNPYTDSELPPHSRGDGLVERRNRRHGTEAEARLPVRFSPRRSCAMNVKVRAARH